MINNLRKINISYYQILLISLSTIIAIIIHFNLPLFRFGQTWGEDSLFYLVAKNISLRGLTLDLFLDDYAIGNNSESHPYYYTHFPTFTGIYIWSLSSFLSLSNIKLFSIIFYLIGQIFTALLFNKLFSRYVSTGYLLVTSVCYAGSLAWSDSTIHSFHWFFVNGSIFLYITSFNLEHPQKEILLKILFSSLFCAFSLFLSPIHTLCILSFCTIYTYLNNIKSQKHLLCLYAAPSLILILHFLRIIYLTSFNIFYTDLSLNILKSSGIENYTNIINKYRSLFIVLWPSDFPNANVYAIFSNIFLKTFSLVGLIPLSILIIFIFFGIFIISSRSKFKFKKYAYPFALISGLLIWTILFPGHTLNYFDATPLIVIYSTTFLSIILFLDYLSQPNFIFSNKLILKTLIIASIALPTARIINNSFAAFSNPSIPGIEALMKYDGFTFYTNGWPFLINFYTNEWVVGGLSPVDASNRNYLASKYFFQRDYSNNNKYENPSYYIYIDDPRFAPYSNLIFNYENMEIIENGENWKIYKFIK